MRKVIILVLALFLVIRPVSALEIAIPDAPKSVQQLIPEEPESFSEGLQYVLRESLKNFRPSFLEAMRICIALLATVLISTLFQSFPASSGKTVEMAGVLAIAILLIHPSDTMIHLGIKTVRELSEYGKLLLPVMTTAVAAQGGVTSSAALYAGTTVFDGFLTSTISNLISPMVYVFLFLSVANSVVGEVVLKQGKSFIKWLLTWSLKIVLYVFTGYIGITGVVSGSADAAAMKATKLTISGVVPVVGGILSDASEAILVSAGLMKNAAGIYGLLVFLAVWIGPFIKIGTQYLMLKICAGICEMFGGKHLVALIRDFGVAMGLLLAMTGSVCLLLMISTVCFMKGAA